MGQITRANSHRVEVEGKEGLEERLREGDGQSDLIRCGSLGCCERGTLQMLWLLYGG